MEAAPGFEVVQQCAHWAVGHSYEGMSNLAVFGIVAGIVSVYVGIAGVTQRILKWDPAKDGPIGVAWPVIIPWRIGEIIFDRVTRPKSGGLPKAQVHK
jgi:hypothetical protein